MQPFLHEAAVVVAEAHEILEALKASKKRKSKKPTVEETKEPNITIETRNSAKDGAVPESEPKPETSSANDKGKFAKQTSLAPAILASPTRNLLISQHKTNQGAKWPL